MQAMRVTPEAIREYYQNSQKDPIILAGMIAAGRNAGYTWDGLTKATNIATGAMHHYGSLLRLPADLQNAVSQKRLTFKSARALADLETHEEMTRHAAPFMDGRLSSGWVEAYIRLAKAHPEWDVESLVEATINPPMPRTADESPASDAGATVAQKPPAYSPVVTPLEIRNDAISLIGKLRMLNGASEVERMPMVSVLRMLKRELEAV